ncbi:MAG: helix-turn-helix transcriptional regulator [Clostridium beijerinckii]|nr:helix-turn-helix transcriptional regulator [Clostridium beijerinckii]
MGNKLKIKRKELEMSVYDVAEKTGLSATYISNLENEQKTNPSKETMNKIARALDSSVPELFFE